MTTRDWRILDDKVMAVDTDNPEEGQLVWVALDGYYDQDCWYPAVYLQPRCEGIDLVAVAGAVPAHWSLRETQAVIPRKAGMVMPPMEAIRPFLNEVEP